MIASLLGGIGLFLLGMILMTDGLKAAAGEALRRVLSRFVSGPLSALLSGAAVTALVQSSSATTLTTIGFVSAGLLTFPQAVGVIFGANLGTTSTGWLVSLLGLKVSVSALALPLIGLGALLKLLTRGRVAAVGLALAGFGLIFVGIDTLQAGMKVLSTRFDPASLPGDSVGGRLLLVLLGSVMTVVMQSSSAAVATTLAALHTGTISLSQAAALVIGQNIGTTVTAAIAAIGASVPARRTSLAHILFNVLTGLVAFAILPLLLHAVVAVSGLLDGEPGATSLALFHTAFNLLGVLLFLPFTQRFAAFITRLVPDRGPPLTRNLDRTVAGIPEVAVEAARRTTAEVGVLVLESLQHLLTGGARREEVEARLEAADQALQETRAFLVGVGAAAGSDTSHLHHLEVLNAAEHLGLLVAAAREPGAYQAADSEPLGLLVERVQAGLPGVLAWLREPAAEAPVASLEDTAHALVELRRAERTRLLGRTAQGLLSPLEVGRLLEGLRWLERVGHHVWRMAHHLHEAGAVRASLSRPSTPGEGPGGVSRPEERGVA